MKILLVEDNEMNRDMLSRRLSRRGYELVFAGDGQEAVDKAGSEAPALILMDMGLPVIDGWEATRRIKADPRTRGIPVIALTAHAMAADRAKCLAAGCDDFDTKPVDIARLLDKIQALAGDVEPGAAATAATTRAFAAASMADLPAVLALVDEACAQVDGSVAFAVRLAAEEVFTNILEHGYGGAAGPVAVSVATTAGSVRLVLDDEAATFDPAAAPRPVLDAALEEREPGGLGWHLVSELMDEVMHAPRSPRGNTYTLVKRLPAPAPAA